MPWNWLGKVPWQVSCAVTVGVYLVILALAWLQPCDTSSMYTGLCGAGKILVTITALVVVAGFLLIVLAVHLLTSRRYPSPRRFQVRNAWVVVTGAVFALGVILVTLLL